MSHVLKRSSGIITILSAILWPLAVPAHHHAVNFSDSTIAVHGAVTKVAWKNPHVYVYVAEEQGGSTVEWEIETGSTPSLTRRGWTQDTLKPGDLITVRGNPDRNPARMFLSAESFSNTDGSALVVRGNNRNADPEARATSVAGVWLAQGAPG